MSAEPDSPPANLDLDASLARLRRWSGRLEAAMREYQATDPEDRDQDLDLRVKDFVLVTSREIGDVLLKARDEVKRAWQEVGKSDAGNRAREWADLVLKSEPVVRGYLATRHADTHVGGVLVLRYVYKSRTEGGTYWMSPKLSEEVHDRLYPGSQLDEDELRLFNSPDELAATLPDVVEKVDGFVRAAVGEANRIRSEEGPARSGEGTAAPTS